MKRNVTQTSIECYYSIKDLRGRQRQVYDAIKRWPYKTDREIAFNMGFGERNAVSPRRNELEHKGLIESCGSKVQENGKRALVWRVRRRPPYV